MMSTAPPRSPEAREASTPPEPAAIPRVALLGNPNTGKTTLFNRLCGLRHKTSNFPGTTQEARVGMARGEREGAAIEIIDLPGVYSLELDQNEAAVCREVLAGTLMPRGEAAGAPDAVCVVLDSTNLARNLVLAGEVLRRRLPTVVAANMIDLARARGLHVDAAALGERLGCAVVLINARSGEGLEELTRALRQPHIPNRTPPGTLDGLERWADEACERATGGEDAAGALAAASTSVDGAASAEGSKAHASEKRATHERATERRATTTWTDRLDRVLTHPVGGVVAFVAIMAFLFWSLFSLAQFPMDAIDGVFNVLGGLVHAALPEGILRDFLSEGVVKGIGATVVFVPQICLLFFLISLLEDTGYLARAAFVVDRWLRPFGLPGHSFVPLLSSHACALPGIMACRGIPDRRERLATILVAPFMTCSARLPVYVLLTGILFHDRPMMAALAFIGCYALGMLAGVLSALLARRTILRGKSRPMALELPTYKVPSLRTALITTWDRGLVFLKKAGTNILAICIVLWWLGAYPRVEPPANAVEIRQQASILPPDRAQDMTAQADRLEAAHAKRHSFIGQLGRVVEPVFAPFGCDWQLSVGVLASFAAREVFGSTMAVVVSGSEDFEDEGVRETIASARREDGVTPVFTPATCWALLVYYVLAMQCLPTLAVTARESGKVRWALLQLAWMSGVAYAAAVAVYQGLRASGVS